MTNKEIEYLLERKDVKPTSNRILVAKELSKVSNPVSLADLEEALDFTMDKASIFRVLEIFATKDIVHVIEDGSRSQKYELCHGSFNHDISDQHMHFYCEKCKETFCLESIPVPEILLPDGFKAHSVNFMVKGICPECQS